MDKTQEQTKKCFCTRCFLPIDESDRVDIEDQSFHRLCSMCCICRTLPTSIKMFYGHVFCSDCFKTHVLSRFKGENPHMHSNSWWMQWAPGAKSQDSENKKDDETNPQAAPEENQKKCFCARCLQPVDDSSKLEIGNQSFHSYCAKCYFCHNIPQNNVKIYYGQVFCEECFHRHVLNQNRDNPNEFFKNCFEHWQNNAQFAENMRDFMGGSKDSSPFVFMMQGQQAPFCRCGTGGQEWFQSNEPKKSATPAIVSVEEESVGTWDLSFENRTETSEPPESCPVDSVVQENVLVAAAEKIEKLTKYLHEKRNITEKQSKKWKNFIEFDKSSIVSQEPTYCAWNELQDPKTSKAVLNCPKCLWQCGPIYVNSEYIKEQFVTEKTPVE